MYKGNYLAERLRAPSIGRDGDAFLYLEPEGEVLSYGVFFAHAEQLANLLTSIGIAPGDRIAVQVQKSVPMLELYMASLLVGAVFLPLNPAYSPAEVSYFLKDATPRVLVCDPKNVANLQAVADGAGVATIFTLDAQGHGSLVDRREEQRAGFHAVPRHEGDLAAILYTSGTTGRSKGAMLSHRALASNSEILRDVWRFDRNDVLIHALPIFHTHGLFVATNITLLAGGSAIFLRAFDADLVCRVMPRATAMMGVPTYYTRLLARPELGQAAQGMRLFVSGSAPLLSETHDRWHAATGHAILERYGMTETNMNTSNPYDGARRAGTVGLPLPGVELRICDADTQDPVPAGGIGIIQVRGPNLFSGYWKMPEKTAEDLREDGFFITGDIAQQDADGYVRIVGRAKDMIISGGLNVYPKEIELLVNDIPGVLESAVIGVPHPDFGEAVIAAIVPEPGAHLASSDITAAISADLANFKRPKRIEFIDALPCNTMGKVQKNQLRTRFQKLFTED